MKGREIFWEGSLCEFKVTPLEPFGVRIEPRLKNNLSEVTASLSWNDVRRVDLKLLRALFYQEQLIVLRGFHPFPTAEAFSEYCSAWGEISVWPFGKVLELVQEDSPQDHIFDHRYVPLHWDGMYRQQVPEFQIFSCVKSPQSQDGGRTTFSHTARAVQNASPSLIENCSQVVGAYERQMAFYHSKTVAPILEAHPNRGFPILRYCEPPFEGDDTFINRSSFQFDGLSEADLQTFHHELRQALYSPRNFYAHSWETGDVLIADNYTLLHGREAFTSGAPRHLRRIHVLGDPPLNNPHLVFHNEPPEEKR